MNFNINNNLISIDRFQVLSSSLDSLVKILVKHEFKYSCQEFDNKVLGLVKQKGFRGGYRISKKLVKISE